MTNTAPKVTAEKLHELAFYFVQNLAWLSSNYNVDLCDETAKSLIDLIKALRK